MNSKSLLILIVGVVVVGIGYAFWAGSNDDAMMAKEATMDKEMDKEEAMSEKQTDMIEKDEAMMDEMEKDMAGDDTIKKAGSYELYSAEKVSMAESGKVVLFFKASWCPTCRGLDANIKSNLEAIPADVTILEVNYDDSTDLKKKYGVTSQHTLVQVAADGSLIKKWAGSQTLESLVGNIQ